MQQGLLLTLLLHFTFHPCSVFYPLASLYNMPLLLLLVDPISHLLP
jgi:hypothetical protein